MKEKFDLVMLSVEDWQILYVNGILFDQGHTIELERFLRTVIGREIIIEGFEDHYLDDFNEDEFPKNLEDVAEYQKLIK